MTSSSITNLGLQLLSVSNLKAEQSYLAALDEQLGTGQQNSNLTDYTPVEAQQLMNFQNAITQRQAYISGMQTVNSRLSVYDQTMTDMENITTEAQQLAAQHPTLDPSKTSQIQQQVQSYMNQVVDDLNQQVGGRYLYAGTRYATSPVNLQAVLNGTVSSSFTPVSANTLPTYDSEYNASSAASATTTATYVANVPANASNGSISPPSTVKVYDSIGNTHNMTFSWTKTGADQWNLSVDVANGVSSVSDYTATIPFTFNSASAANNPGTIVSGGIGSGNGSSNNYTVVDNTQPPAEVSFALGFPGAAAQTLTLDFGSYDTAGGLAQLADATNEVSVTSFTADGGGGGLYDPKAWAQDSVTIDSAFNVTYGVTSTQTGFQQLIAGMQLINQATQAGVSSATYQQDMNQANALLNQALTNIQSYHTGVAAATNTLSQEQTTQNDDITNLQNELSNIQQVDLSKVGTQINILETQLQASYSATASLTQLSILKYL